MHTRTTIQQRAREIAAITLAASSASSQGVTRPWASQASRTTHATQPKLRAVAVAALVLTAAHTATAQVDPRSEYTPLATSTGAGSGFKDHFSPFAGNIPQTGDTVALSIQVPALQARKWRAFLPPGTKRLYADIQFAPATSAGTVSLRGRAAPTGGTPPVGRYFDISSTLERLASGSELAFSAPAGSSALDLASSIYDISLGSYTAAAGGWVYVNSSALPANQQVRFRAEVLSSCYLAWHAVAKFDTAGNPLQNANHTCTGTTILGAEPADTSTPPVTPPVNPPVTPPVAEPDPDFTLAHTISPLVPGKPIRITISPASVNLASCSATTNGATSATGALSIALANGVLAASGTAPQIERPETATLLKVSCTSRGGKTVSITGFMAPDNTTSPVTPPVTPPVQEQSASFNATKTSGTNGTFTLSGTFKPATAGIGKPTTFWTGIVTAPFFGPSVILVKSGQGWAPYGPATGLTAANALATASPGAAGLPLNLIRSDLTEGELAAINSNVYLVYQVNGGDLQIFPTPVMQCKNGACTTQ